MSKVASAGAAFLLLTDICGYGPRRSPGTTDRYCLLWRDIRRQHGNLRPQFLPALGLLLVVRRRKIRARIRPHDHVCEIVKSIGRVDVVTVSRAADADARVPGQETIDAVSRTGERRIGQAVFLGIPEMDARLIAHLDLGAEFREP